jgi:plastocyanin
MLLARRSFYLIMLTVLAILMVACSGSQDSEPEPTNVQLKLSEFAIEPDTISVKPGLVTLEVENGGFVEHNILIRELDEGLDFIFPGETHNFGIQLESGTYTLVCTVEGHEEAGMVGTLIVEE